MDEAGESFDEIGKAESSPLPSARFALPARATAREKLHAFLATRPGGADGAELAGLLFRGAGSDPDLGPRLIHGLIGNDPNFQHDIESGLWSLRAAASLRVPLDDAPFVVVDLET